MKKRRFLAYIAAIMASASVVVGCSDNNEPPFEPTPEPSGAETKNDSEYKYPTDTIIYVDERTEDEKEIILCGLMHKVDCILSQGEKRPTEADNLPYRVQVV